MNMQQKLAVVALDIAILAEVCVSMYLASKDMDQLTPIFLKNFLGMLIPTLIAAKIAIRRLRTKEARVGA